MISLCKGYYAKSSTIYWMKMWVNIYFIMSNVKKKKKKDPLTEMSKICVLINKGIFFNFQDYASKPIAFYNSKPS